LPPVPPLSVDAGLRQLLDRALLALGRLDSIATLLPNPDLFLYSYVRKEALLSSQIEGTQSSLADLLLFEVDAAPGVPFDDVVEPVTTIARLAQRTGLSIPGATAAVERLATLNLVQEVTGRQRGRVFTYAPYVALLGEGTEPLTS